MIKIGLSAKTPDITGLVKKLRSHPDVEIMWIYNNGNVARVANIFPELVGEYDGCFSDQPFFDNIDLYVGPFDRRINGYPEIKAIITGEMPSAGECNCEIVLGVPEYNRKALVRGAKVTILPDQMTLAGALALMPLAKNLLLNCTVNGAILFSNKDPRRADSADGRFLDSHTTGTLINDILSRLQTSFNSPLRILPFTVSDDVAMLTITVDLALSTDDAVKLYHDFYHDHRHVVLIENPANPIKASMVHGTNKAVISITGDNTTLAVTTCFDARLKQGSGMIIHLLNLLFGLDERTGF